MISESAVPTLLLSIRGLHFPGLSDSAGVLVRVQSNDSICCSLELARVLVCHSDLVRIVRSAWPISRNTKVRAVVLCEDRNCRRSRPIAGGHC
jgi:hypothetical protein